MKKLLVLLLCACLVGCENYVARKYGGSTTINLEKGRKLLEVTWKGEASIWYLTEPMDSDYIPKTKIFQENSQFGIMEGKVIFIESR